ncbi:MAG: cation diffusion facilitator family transporter [Candidatus Marinimicrobia bacterium]|nr:cation diffusion facilitator family transporter [Candidatus Neomarinimicrobiota bacterium]MCF7840578.1 cation diffusion facilitator family transporter [Candidatus Neomarinimicrobiota bacterium]MCF7902138.1 cation diffusion facilitator family transporter [Candidatus Neomarinimicrobiota bacterium]
MESGKTAEIVDTVPVESRQNKAALVPLTVAGTLAIIKLVAGLMTFSVGVIASAIDSFMDFFVSLGNFIFIRISHEPADREHPYGHGKSQEIAALLESIIIFGSTVYLIYTAVDRIFNPKEIGMTQLAIVVMLISLLGSVGVSIFLRRRSRATESIALEADSVHYTTDIYSNGGILLGLMLIHLTGFQLIDVILTLAMSIFILKSVWDLFRNALDRLMDYKLPDSVNQDILTTIMDHSVKIIGYHNFRTRRSGPYKFIDFHLDICRETPFVEAHDITDGLEQKIQKLVPGSNVLIHMDPCDETCPGVDSCEFIQKSSKSTSASPE